jgi:hypothetical protein
MALIRGIRGLDMIHVNLNTVSDDVRQVILSWKDCLAWQNYPLLGGEQTTLGAAPTAA